MSQVLTNLIINAEQAVSECKDGGKITISTDSTDSSGRQKIMITVADSGPGISSAQLHDVFDPFFTTRQVGKGTGLGLAVCYGIVRAHSGEISVDSKPGQGAKFTISLPVPPGMY